VVRAYRSPGVDTSPNLLGVLASIRGLVVESAGEFS